MGETRRAWVLPACLACAAVIPSLLFGFIFGQVGTVAQAECDRLQGEIRQLQTDLADARNQISAHAGAVAKSSQAVESRDKEVALLKNDLATLKQQRGLPEWADAEAWAAKDADIERLKGEISSLSRKLTIPNERPAPRRVEDSGPKPAAAGDAEFRNVKWGMSQAEVRAREHAELVLEDEDILGYEDRITGLKCGVGYIFAQAKLVRARYVIKERHTNNNDHIAEYLKLKELLTEKYGQPKEDETLWRNDLYRDDPSEYGTAVSLGHLLFYTKWGTPETEVVLGLSGDNFHISHSVDYTSKRLGHLEEEAKKKRAIKDF